MLAFKQLIGRDVYQAGGLAQPLPGGNDADIPFPQPAVHRLFEDPQGASLHEFVTNHRVYVLVWFKIFCGTCSSSRKKRNTAEDSGLNPIFSFPGIPS